MFMFFAICKVNKNSSGSIFKTLTQFGVSYSYTKISVNNMILFLSLLFLSCLVPTIRGLMYHSFPICKYLNIILNSV